MKIIAKKESEHNLLIGFETVDTYGVEAVYSKKSRCLCISTQVGCATGCCFCASGRNGFKRNLSAEEMYEEYAWFADAGYSIEIMHLGGIGEPLRNLKNVLVLKNCISGVIWQITTSMPRKELFMKTVANGFDRIIISLHSMNQETRYHLIPNSMSIVQIMETIRECMAQDGGLKDIIRISYLQLGKVNTSVQEQEAFIKVCREYNLILLLLAYNKIDQRNEFVMDEKAYKRLVKRIVGDKIRCEDCVYSSSRRDAVGGCGTLVMHKKE